MKTRPLLLALLIAGVTFAAFAGALANGFVLYDDPAYVTNNPPVAAGLTAAGARWALTAFHSANWHPLTWMSHMLDVQFYGLEPRGHHLTSILLHALNGALFFLVLRIYTGSTHRSLAAALLFALHPLRVESVAWIAERKDVLSTAFFLATLLAWRRWTRAPSSIGRYSVALLLFAGGLMSKSMVVTLPCVLLLLDAWPLERLRERGYRRLLMEKLPFFALSTAAAFAAYSSQAAFGSTGSLEALDLGARSSNAVLAYGVYLAKCVWPTNLACIYPHPSVSGVDVFVPTALAGLALISLGALGAWAMLSRRKRPYLLWGLAWFLGTLVPVIGLVQIGNQGWADRYTYLPGMGLVVALVWGIASLRPPRAAARGGLLLVLIGLTVVTVRQVRTWRDGESLFRHATEVTEGNYVAWSNLGIVLTRAGRKPEAMDAYRAALAVRPEQSEANNNLGGLLLGAGRIQEAVPFLRAAVRANPGYVAAHMNLGYARAKQGLRKEAALHYRDAVRAGPEDAPARLSLGIALAELGEWQAAAVELRRAQALGHPGARAPLARVQVEIQKSGG